MPLLLESGGSKGRQGGTKGAKGEEGGRRGGLLLLTDLDDLADALDADVEVVSVFVSLPDDDASCREHDLAHG